MDFHGTSCPIHAPLQSHTGPSTEDVCFDPEVHQHRGTHESSDTGNDLDVASSSQTMRAIRTTSVFCPASSPTSRIISSQTLLGDRSFSVATFSPEESYIFHGLAGSSNQLSRRSAMREPSLIENSQNHNSVSFSTNLGGRPSSHPRWTEFEVSKRCRTRRGDRVQRSSGYTRRWISFAAVMDF